MKVMIMAGGTGGHVYPALAVAEALRGRGHEIVWMGAPDSFESRAVAPHGIPIETIAVSGLRGKGLGKLAKAPLLVWRAVAQALAALRRQQPQVVLGMGGFAAGPGGLAARLLRLPLVIHEQNAAAGLTNRCLARIASHVLQAFPGTFRSAQTVGNPVRPAIAALPAPALRGIGTHAPLRLLVLGGSQGARALNERVPEALAQLPPDIRPQVRHQAGRTLDVARAAYARAGVEAQVEAFIDDMPAAYAAADLVVCRAGASTIAELCAAGCAALLVPFPFAVDDHQTCNGAYLTEAGAAVLVQERELDAARLAAELRVLLGDPARLAAMAAAARARAWPDATDAIVAALLSAAEAA